MITRILCENTEHGRSEVGPLKIKNPTQGSSDEYSSRVNTALNLSNKKFDGFISAEDQGETR